MASRATIAQLRQLGLDSFALDQMSTADKQAALDSASARLDSALATQFTLPIVAPYPLDIIECECVLASWTLLMVRGYNAPTGVDENIKERYLMWEAYLDKVSKGELVPSVVDSGTGGDYGSTGPSVITATQRGYSERGVSISNPPRPLTGPFSGD